MLETRYSTELSVAGTGMPTDEMLTESASRELSIAEGMLTERLKTFYGFATFSKILREESETGEAWRFSVGKNLRHLFPDRRTASDQTAGEGNVFNDATMVMCELESCNLSKLHLHGSILSGSNFQGASFRGANLSSAILQEACLVKSDLSESDLSNALLPNANLREANLASANLTDAVFEGADLRYANLTGALLQGTSFYKADLTGAIFDQMSFSGIDFELATGAPAEASRGAEADRIIQDEGSVRSEGNKVTIFFGTDRKHDRGPVRPNHYFGAERAEPTKLSIGSCDVSLPKDRPVGDSMRPWLSRNEDPEQHVVLQSVTELGARDFNKALAKAVGASEIPEALVFVHGFNVSFAYAARCVARLKEDIGFHGVCVLYSWSSHNRLFLYRADEERVKLARHTFRPLLQSLSTCAGLKRIHIVGHSMGCRALLDVFRDLETDPFTANELVFAAPDVAREDFEATINAYKKRPARFISLYAAARDLALQISNAISTFRRAGQAKPLLVMDGVETIDASMVDGGGLRHSYFAMSRPVTTDLSALIVGQTRPDKRPLDRSDVRGRRYWKFRS